MGMPTAARMPSLPTMAPNGPVASRSPVSRAGCPVRSVAVWIIPGCSLIRKPTGTRSASSRLRVAGLELDEDGHEVRRDGTVIALTPTEFRLPRFLMLNAGRVLSKRQILDHVWDHNPAGDGNVVEPCVSYLRRKVDQGEPHLIHTIRGVGYVLRIPPP